MKLEPQDGSKEWERVWVCLKKLFEESVYDGIDLERYPDEVSGQEAFGVVGIHRSYPYLIGSLV